MRAAHFVAAAVVGLALWAGAAVAGVVEGQVAPDFTKNQLDYPAPFQYTPRSLSEFSGKVIFLFALGYNCPVCLGDGPSVEQDVRAYYDANFPGQVQVVGVDVWDGNEAQLRGFRTSTGATYPLLLRGGSATGGDVDQLYGPFDTHYVISKQGIVRLNTFKWPHGDRFRLNEIRACIDSLVMNTAAVGDGGSLAGHVLRASPNPFRGATSIELVNSGREGLPARVAVHDVAGRKIATLWERPAPAGVTRLIWDGRSESGQGMPAGVYVIRAEIGGFALSRRVVRVP